MLSIQMIYQQILSIEDPFILRTQNKKGSIHNAILNAKRTILN